jgi:hypothetical protein
MRPIWLAVLGVVTMSVAAHAGGSTGAGAWKLEKPGEGASACVLTPKEPSRIQVGRDRLTVTGLPKNSIFNYQYRIDDGGASTPSLPTPEMQNAGTITLDGDAFAAVLKGQRFRIRILDRWHEAITEDVSLAGLGELHGTMAEACR